MLDMLGDIFDFSMFLELHFLLLSMTTILLFTWFIVPYFYLGDYVVIRGLSESQASSLLSCIGVLNTIGMVSFPVIRGITLALHTGCPGFEYGAGRKKVCEWILSDSLIGLLKKISRFFNVSSE